MNWFVQHGQLIQIHVLVFTHLKLYGAEPKIIDDVPFITLNQIKYDP